MKINEEPRIDPLKAARMATGSYPGGFRLVAGGSSGRRIHGARAVNIYHPPALRSPATAGQA